MHVCSNAIDPNNKFASFDRSIRMCNSMQCNAQRQRQIQEGGGYMSNPKRRRLTAAASASASASSIPEDVLFSHVLVLLPVKSLMRFQSVCKAWCAAIRSTHFSRHHLESSRARSSCSSSSPPSMAVVPRKCEQYPLKFGVRFVNIYRFQPGRSNVAELMLGKKFPDGIPLWSTPLHCDGLILIPSVKGRLSVCNPATGEFVQLPMGSRSAANNQRAAFGFDPWTATYKVARHFLRSDSEVELDEQRRIMGHDVGHEILTLGGGGEESWKWKATVDPPYPIKNRTPACLRGFFYWSAVHTLGIDGHGFNVDVILRFSIRDETFTVHPNPPCRGFLSDFDSLCELGGKLCYVHSATEWSVSVWLAEDHGPNLTWSRRCRVSLPVCMYHRVFACASDDQDKVFLSVDAQEVFKCDLRDGSLEPIINMAHGVTYHHGNGISFTTGTLPITHYMVPFVESLLRIRPW